MNFQRTIAVSKVSSAFNKLTAAFSKVTISKIKPKKIYCRDYKNFDEAKFINESSNR